MTTLSLSLLLVVPCRSAKLPVPVESPSGHLVLEDTDDPLTINWRRSHCEERQEKAKRFRSESAAFDLLPCLSHPSSAVRWETLYALDKREYFLRPDFEKVILPKLRLAVDYSSKDQDITVRQYAGQLSRDIESWENSASPRAKARAEQFRKDERKRFWRDLCKPDSEQGHVFITLLFPILALLCWVVFKSRRR